MKEDNPRELGYILKHYGGLVAVVIGALGGLCGAVLLSQYQIQELFSIADQHTSQISEQKKDSSNQSNQIAVLDVKMDMVSQNVIDIKKYLKVPS